MTKKYGRPEIEMGKVGGGGTGGGGSARSTHPMGKMTKAEKEKVKKDIIDENVRRDVGIAKKAPERKAAASQAKTTTEQGVKVTKYPYVEPSKARKNYRSLDDALKRVDEIDEYKKGGMVTRGDGCAKRGKTKGRTY